MSKKPLLATTATIAATMSDDGLRLLSQEYSKCQLVKYRCCRQPKGMV